MKTVFLRALEAQDKAAALLSAIREPETARSNRRFEVDTQSFGSIPRSPFSYWAPTSVMRVFVTCVALSESDRLVVSTNPLNDDSRYVREWWEVAVLAAIDQWRPWAKGGAYSTIYYDIDTVITWDSSRRTYSGFLGTLNRPLERPASVQHFFRPGLTWPRRTNGLSTRVMPAGCIFADKGPAIFARADDWATLLGLAAITSSRVFTILVTLQLARTELAQSYEVGLIQNIPVPVVSKSELDPLAVLSKRSWSRKRSLDTRTETSHAFTLPALLQVDGETLVRRAAVWAEHVRSVEAELAAIQSEIDNQCLDLYGIDAADQRVITEGFGGKNNPAAEDPKGEVDDDADTEISEAATADAATLTTELLSWAVGVAFGRFDLRLATGERAVPAEPEPFDPLPACSPGMLTGEDGLPLNAPPTGYPIDFPTDGVLVDDGGHPRDLTARVRAVFETVFGPAADARWNEAAALLDPRERNLRAWLAQTFFDQHLKRHSKSRRKAPIVWQIGTPSAEYSIWLYAHHLTKDSFFQVQNDLVGPKLALEERKLLGLVQAAGPNPSSSQRKELAAQEAFIEALRGMLDEVKRVAPLWAPDLNDGIVLTMAPLWRLVPQHKGWQKELKAAWETLCAGCYDWAHLAMHLWPERVVPKCATDRSLAIAHDLEDVFWAVGADGKWKPRATPTKTVEALVAERRSPAVKAALKSLLEAPMSKTGGARGRRAAGENS